MKKLVLFVDSLFGQCGKTQIQMLERLLNDYDVYNCAAGGWNTSDCTRKAPYIGKLEPDALVISLGTNDASPWEQVLIETFKSNIFEIFGSFPNSRILYFLPPPIDEAKTTSEYKGFKNAD